MNEKKRKFAAIDFETANWYRTSICSVGIVLVEDGTVSDTFYSLINPRPDFYTSFNTRIHGLSGSDTADAPSFPEVWSDVSSMLNGLPLIAHNSPFDEGCLKAVFGFYEMDYPEYTFLCTCRASRKKFPFLPNHKLNTVAAHCGFDLVDHHHALADAQACAAIALKVFEF